MTAHGEEVLYIACGSGAERAASADSFGFKACNLWRMARLGLPVPPAFVLGTEFCRDFFRGGGEPPQGLRELLQAGIRQVEAATGLVFGGPRKPLVVSVRSGAPVSMPGMLDTVLDVGVNDQTVRGLVRMSGNPRMAWDCYRRLLRSFAETVHRCPGRDFDAVRDEHLRRLGLERVEDMDFQQLAALAEECRELFEDLSGQAFPQNPMQQLEAAVMAVWRSWSSARAVEYRRLNAFPDDLGTAVTVQRMVFGNAGGASGSGVGFTRDPATGENRIYLDFLFNIQGDDLVSGRSSAADTALLAEALPDTFQEMTRVSQKLEREYRDVQEFEFTVENARLFLLQTRIGKRTPWAALRIAVEQVREGLIDPREGWARIRELDLDRIERTRALAPEGARLLCRAVPASVGVASGAIALDPDVARSMANAGRHAVLVRESASTADIAGIAVADGLLTAAGGKTSHAAVVARQMGKVCLVGCDALSVDISRRRCTIAGAEFAEGEIISLDGESGSVLAGEVRVVVERPSSWLAEVALWRRAA